MTAVDVLAVFDRAKEWVDCDLSICDDENRPDELRHGLTEARAAVAELIEAGEEFASCDSLDAQKRFKAALARAGGAA